MQRPSAPLVVVALVALVAAVAGIRAAVATKRPAGDFLRYDRAATLVWRGASERLYDNTDLASGPVWHDPVRFPERSFRYSPGLALLLAPLGALPPQRGWIVWSMLCGALLAGAAALSGALGTRGLPALSRLRWLPAAVAVLPLLHLYSENLKLGQMNCLAIGCSVGSVWAFERRRERLAGGLAAVAVVAKHIPILLILWFAWRRQWRAAATGAVVTVILLYALPTALLGPARHHALLGQWVGQQGHLLTGANVEHAGGLGSGQSLKALLYRWLTPTPYVHLKSDADDASPGARGIAVLDAVDLPRATVFALWCATVAAVLIAAARATAPIRGESEEAAASRLPLEGGLVLATMLLVSPESRNPHFQTLALGYAALAAALIASRWRERGVALAAALGMVLVLLSTRGLVGRDGADYLLAWGSIGWGALLVFGALLVTLRRLRREALGTLAASRR
jgi:hypothetical protein